MATPRRGPVERATRAKLRALGYAVASDALAAATVALAQILDASVSAIGVAAVAAQHRLNLERLEGAAVRPEKDGIDELNARRAVRRAAAG